MLASHFILRSELLSLSLVSDISPEKKKERGGRNERKKGEEGPTVSTTTYTHSLHTPLTPAIPPSKQPINAPVLGALAPHVFDTPPCAPVSSAGR